MWTLGFGAWGLGFRSGVVFGVRVFMIQGCGFGVWGLGSGFRF